MDKLLLGTLRAIWSPDGASIVFNSRRRGHLDLYQKPTNGVGIEQLLYADDLDKTPTSWSPDGKFLLYSAVDMASRVVHLWDHDELRRAANKVDSTSVE